MEQNRSTTRQKRILEAALEVFSRRGYRDTAVDEIAAEAATSKGGVYFHFPSKQSIFFALLDQTAHLLHARAEAAMDAEADPVRQLDAALRVVLETFGSHRALARLFLVDALGAGREFNRKIMELHLEFAALIERRLAQAVSAGAIPPLDTRTASLAWFGALNEVVTHWALAEQPGRLEDSYPALREFMLGSVGAGPAGSESRS